MGSKFQAKYSSPLAKICDLERLGRLGTNSIIIESSKGADWNIKEQFKWFGDIIGEPSAYPGSTPAILVAFYDCRSAAVALKAARAREYNPKVGSTRYRPGPQVGDRSVRLPGDMILTDRDREGIYNSTINPDDDSIHAEFYDIRDALEAQQRAAECV